MKIYFLDSDPYQCAKYHCDKHISIRILETSNILCSAHIFSDDPVSNGQIDYRTEALENLPMTITSRIALIQDNQHCVWVRESIQNYRWLSELGWALCQEYTIRWDKKHKYEIYIQWLRVNEPKLPDIGLTKFRLLIPSQYEGDDPIESYRKYYIGDKARIAKWTKREKPHWFIVETKHASIIGDRIMETTNKANEAMELHKKEYSNKEISEAMGVSVKRVEQLLHRARNPRIHEIQGHYKKIITTLDEALSIRGKYMSITLTNFLFNIPLQPESIYNDNNLKTYNLVEFIYHNIWIARMSISGGEKCLIDSEGFQHRLGDICDHIKYTKWIQNDAATRDVFFPWPELTLESKAKTRGWWWLSPLKEGVVPHRFILRFDIFNPGDTSGWVQDHETLELEFLNAELISQFANNSHEQFLKREIGQPL